MVLMYLVYVNTLIDGHNFINLSTTISHNEIDKKFLPKVKDIDRLTIESVVSEYMIKKDMNVSNSSKIWTEVKSGVVKGALAGSVIGGGAQGAITSAVVYGTLGGMMKAYTLS